MLAINGVYIVLSLPSATDRNVKVNETVETNDVAQAEFEPSPTEAIPAAPVEEDTAALVETVVSITGDSVVGNALYQSSYVRCLGLNAIGQGIFPKLAGQTAEKIAADLRAYRAGEKTGPMAGMMAPMAAGLSDGEIDNLAAFISGL